jgi:tetratricopeptide (TPR) repeat protein
LLDRLIHAEPTADHFDRRGQVHAALKKYDRAASDFAEASRLDPVAAGWRDSLVWYGAGLVCLASGDHAGYRRVCSERLKLIERQPGDAIEKLPDLVLLSDTDKADLSTLLGPLRKQTADYPKSGINWLQLAAVQFRLGPVDAAVLERAEEYARTAEAPLGWLFLALIQNRAGRTAEARAWLARSIHWLEDDPVKARKRVWWQDLEVRLLRREVEAVLGEPKP